MKQAYKSMSAITDHIISTVSSSSFLEKRGLGNEIPFFICPYNVENSVDMAQSITMITERLQSKYNVSVLSINLYDLSIDILKARSLWDRVIQTEKEYSKTQMKELFQNVLDVNSHIVPKIEEKMNSANFDVLFLHGIGEVYPYIRSHNVLNNLQSKAKDKPTVLFFPGEYSHSTVGGASLNLFGKLEDDKYYRAFNIFDYATKD